MNAIQEPATDSGTEMMNHIRTMMIIVVNGTAPEEPFAHRKRLRKKNMENTIPGTRNGVREMFNFHDSPPKVL